MTDLQTAIRVQQTDCDYLLEADIDALEANYSLPVVYEALTVFLDAWRAPETYVYYDPKTASWLASPEAYTAYTSVKQKQSVYFRALLNALGTKLSGPLYGSFGPTLACLDSVYKMESALTQAAEDIMSHKLQLIYGMFHTDGCWEVELKNIQEAVNAYGIPITLFTMTLWTQQLNYDYARSTRQNMTPGHPYKLGSSIKAACFDETTQSHVQVPSLKGNMFLLESFFKTDLAQGSYRIEELLCFAAQYMAIEWLTSD